MEVIIAALAVLVVVLFIMVVNVIMSTSKKSRRAGVYSTKGNTDSHDIWGGFDGGDD